MVYESTKLSATLRAMANKPHINAAEQARSNPLVDSDIFRKLHKKVLGKNTISLNNYI